VKKSKVAFVLLIALVTILTLTAFVGSVKAQGNISFQASISSDNKSVAENTHNTFTVTNTGASQLGDINITIPGGYGKLENLTITQEPISQNWTIKNEGNYIVLYGSSQGLNAGQSITFAFDEKNPAFANTYKWSVGGNVSTTAEGLNVPASTLIVTENITITTIMAASIIFAIAAGIAFLNTGLNRVLINYFVGWEQYRVMQKEMNEYRQETMAAARANDKKQMEKLKKKQSQVNAMQAKMMKPQMVQFGISFLYIFVWFLVLTPTFGNTSMVYLPGFGPLSVIYWYPICSFFLGLLGSRILGIMPIENN
jgi:uncharacterized membrane protein (DUF106 family)